MCNATDGHEYPAQGYRTPEDVRRLFDRYRALVPDPARPTTRRRFARREDKERTPALAGK